ncbi:MAG: ATP-binding protein [Saccharofermentans sp.]|nr:ATP-binding protein [Saccharofermentans sp.]
MLNDETKRKLRELNIGEVINAIEYQDQDPATVSLPFEERFQRVVDYLYQEKYNSKIQRLIKSAKFRFPQADLHSIYYEGRTLNREAINEISTAQFIRNRQSIVFQGYTGSGKTFLACAIGKEVCRQQVRTRYIRLPDLLMEYGDAKVIAGQEKKIIAKYAKIPLLILDEWLMADISADELHFLFELTERRSDTTSTIFCTQYSKKDWIKKLGEGVYAEAIVDRYAYNTVWIETGRINMRKYCANRK